jgi:hypothetical protein
MTEKLIWDRMADLITRCRWEYQYTLQERELMLDQLQDCLIELRTRGTQLAMSPEDHPA